MSAWGLMSKGGVVTEAPSEDKARRWADYDFKGRLGEVWERLVTLDQETSEWVEPTA